MAGNTLCCIVGVSRAYHIVRFRGAVVCCKVGVRDLPCMTRKFNSNI